MCLVRWHYCYSDFIFFFFFNFKFLFFAFFGDFNFQLLKALPFWGSPDGKKRPDLTSFALYLLKNFMEEKDHMVRTVEFLKENG